MAERICLKQGENKMHARKIVKTIAGITAAVLLCLGSTACTKTQEKEDSAERSRPVQSESSLEQSQPEQSESSPEQSQTDQSESSGEQEVSAESGNEAVGEQVVFAAPRIGSFYERDPEGAEVTEAEDGTLFGFPEWLSDGCSTWCGCEEYRCEAKASSQQADRGEISFAPSNVVYHTGDNSDMLDTVWAEGVAGTGVGESIEICQMYRGNGEENFTFTEICIVNGYAKDEDSFQENGRVKAFRVYYNDDCLGEMNLLDTRQPQYIDLSPFGLQVKNGGEAVFRFEIADVCEGTKYEDTCITGIVIDFAGRIGH